MTLVFYDQDGDGSQEGPECDRGQRDLTMTLHCDVEANDTIGVEANDTIGVRFRLAKPVHSDYNAHQIRGAAQLGSGRTVRVDEVEGSNPLSLARIIGACAPR